MGAPSLLDPHLQPIGGDAVDRKRDIHLASPAERFRQPHVRLVQAEVGALGPGVSHFRGNAAYCASHGGQVAAIADAGAIENQVDVIRVSAEIDRRGGAVAPLGVALECE